ncbi:MAG: hypothetical protein K0R38_2862 [Polyangiaceae bacterium]|jgi:hypothetical protein|nr:hypothetical protein [Polyangiaceae bacterium]
MSRLDHNRISVSIRYRYPRHFQQPARAPVHQTPQRKAGCTGATPTSSGLDSARAGEPCRDLVGSMTASSSGSREVEDMPCKTTCFVTASLSLGARNLISGRSSRYSTRSRFSRTKLAAFVVIACCGLFACRRHRNLVPPPGCKTPEVITCLSKYALEELNESALEHLLEEGIHECFAGDPRILREQGSCLPITLGRDKKSGLPVVANYSCSDICPDRGSILLTLHAKLDRASCCRVGGTPFIDGAFGGYYGCMPVVADKALRNAACRQ